MTGSRGVERFSLPDSFRRVMDAAPVPVLATDHAGYNVYANPSVKALLGYDRVSLDGKHFTEIIPVEADLLEFGFQRLKARGTWSGRLPVQGANGELSYVGANVWELNPGDARNALYVGLLHPLADPGVDSRLVARAGQQWELTPREICLLHLIAEGFCDKQLACILGASVWTVNKGVGSVLRKLNASSRTEASVRAIKAGLIV